MSFQLWEAGSVAISESPEDDGCLLTAGFDNANARSGLLKQFAEYAPEWREDRTDWVALTKQAWPARAVGTKLFLAPVWCAEPTPLGRFRLVHNPGQASGTGEHPCTQLALEALEQNVFPNCQVLDVGTGSGILAIAARLLGAQTALGLDPDGEALRTARENFHLNGRPALLAAGSAECAASGQFNITVANINASVLLSIAHDLLRVTASCGVLILTGFPRAEASAFRELAPRAEVSYSGDWACVVAKLSSSASPAL